MASVTWTATAGGNWSTGSNWSTGAAPQRGDDVSISTSSATVTYSTGTLILDSLTTATTLLDITGGSLTSENGYSLNGGLEMTGGAMRLVNGAYGDLLAGALDIAGGTLTLAGGAVAQQENSSGFTLASGAALAINGGSFTDSEATGTLAGTVSGSGALVFDAGITNLESGLALTVATTDILAGTVQLNAKLADSRNFQLGYSGTLSLNSQVLTLSKGGLYGVITNGGTLIEAGIGIINSTVVDNGSLLDITGTVNQTGTIILAQTGAGSMQVASAGTLRITGNYSVDNAGGGALITNAGTIDKVGGGNANGQAAYFYAPVNNTGTIDAAVGTIDFAGPNSSAIISTIGGTLSGDTIAFTQGYYNFDPTSATVAHLQFGGSSNVTLTSALTYNNNWTQNGGLLLLDQALTLNGNTAFDGGEMKGTATVSIGTTLSAGTLHLGSTMDLEGNLNFLLYGNVVQTGAINLGALSDSIDQATLEAGSTWALEGAASIAGAYGTITDLGTFVKLDGAQNSVVASDFTSTGTVSVDSGTLSLTGHGALGGTVNGAAVLDIGGAFTLSAGLALTVGEFILDQSSQVTLSSALSYARDWASEGGTLDLLGGNLTLTGTTSLLSGAISGTGTVTVTGPAAIAGAGLFQVAQGADLIVTGGIVEQQGNLLLTSGSTSPTLTIAAGTTYIMDAGVYTGDNGGSPVGTVTIQKGGVLEANGAGAITKIDSTIVNSGSILLNYGEMAFQGPLEGNGVVKISNGATLDLNYSASVTSAIGFGTGGGVLYLDFPNDFTGTIDNFTTGDVIELNGFAFGATLQVSSNDVTITGSTGQSIVLAFNSPQSAGSLTLGEGPHLGLALIHT